MNAVMNNPKKRSKKNDEEDDSDEKQKKNPKEKKRRGPDEDGEYQLSKSDEMDGKEDDVSSDEEDPYDEEGYLGSEDQEELFKLPENEREQILYERSKKKDAIKERNYLRHIRRSRQKTSHTKAIRKNALQALSAQRESLKKKSTYSDDYSMGTAKSKKSSNRKKNELDMENLIKLSNNLTFSQMSQVVVTRDQLIKWVDEPYWDQCVPGLFVVVHFLTNQNEQVYRLAQIDSIIDDDTLSGYKINDREFNIRLVLKIASNTRQWTLQYVSNRPLDESTFVYWKNLLLMECWPVPSEQEIKRLNANIQTASNYIKTDHDIDIMVKRRQEKKKSLYSPEFKQMTLRRLEEAKLSGDTEAVKRLEQDLQKIHQKELEKIENEKMTLAQVNTIEAINEKNRLKNLIAENAYITEFSDGIEDRFLRLPISGTLTPKLNKNEKMDENPSISPTNNKYSTPHPIGIDSLLNVPKLPLANNIPNATPSPGRKLTLSEYLTSKSQH